ncbi:MAG: PDZ domain-containing protein, partial [Rhodospirillales bacterium]|nr:PDZ domain-containing protein [Rhodospirillales bacterium]
VLRGGKKKRLVLDLIKAPEDPPRNLSRLKGRHPFSGSVVANLSPALAEELSIDTMERGVIILKLSSDSPAHRVGLQPGDVILMVNGKKIKRIKILGEILSQHPRVWRVSLRRGGQILSFTVES